MFRKANEELYMTQYEEMQHRKIARYKMVLTPNKKSGRMGIS